MSGRHICQFGSEERNALTSELFDIVQRLNSGSRHEKFYTPDNPPNFLREKIPRYKPNPDIVPLITHTGFVDVRPTADPTLLRREKEDLRTIYVNLGGNENPYRTDWDDSDPCRPSTRPTMTGSNNGNNGNNGNYGCSANLTTPSYSAGNMQLCCIPFGACNLVPNCTPTCFPPSYPYC